MSLVTIHLLAVSPTFLRAEENIVWSFNGRETAAEVNLVAVLPSIAARLTRSLNHRKVKLWCRWCMVELKGWRRKEKIKY